MKWISSKHLKPKLDNDEIDDMLASLLQLDTSGQFKLDEY